MIDKFPLGLKEKNEKEVARMFDDISPNYDFLNHFLSLGMDIYWKNKLVKCVSNSKPENILDIATGTAAIALSIAKKLPHSRIVGIDISDKMLALAGIKIKRKRLGNQIEIKNASALKLPFQDNFFDAVTIAYGIRNFENTDIALSEIYRVLKNEACLFILEFSTPKNKFINPVYNLYFSLILPFLGKLISGHCSAYKYLNKSATEFPHSEQFTQILRRNGFKHATYRNLSAGITCIYEAKKIVV